MPGAKLAHPQSREGWGEAGHGYAQYSTHLHSPRGPNYNNNVISRIPSGRRLNLRASLFNTLGGDRLPPADLELS